MASEPLAPLLATPLLAGLDEAVRGRLLAIAEPRLLEAGEVLLRQGEEGDALYLVLAGRLQIQRRRPDGSVLALASIGAGEVAGEIQLLVGGSRTATVRAEGEARVVRLPRAGLLPLLEESPELLSRLLSLVRRRLQGQQQADLLPALLGPLDDEDARPALGSTARWVTLAAGETLFRQGDPADSFYLVSSGRLLAVDTDGEGRERVVGEMGRGQGVGEIALLTGRPRTASVHALRDSELLRFGVDEFSQILARHPRALSSLTRSLVERLLSYSRGAGPARSRLSTLALLPLGAGRPLEELSSRLAAELATVGPTLRVSSARLEQLGVIADGSRRPADHPSWLRVAAWLEEQSLSHRFVLLEADPTPSGWSQRALRFADHLLLVGHVDDPAGAGPLAPLLDRQAPPLRRTGRTLLLLHPGGARGFAGTAAWLARVPVDRHVHLRLDRRADLARLARVLSDRAVSLVLSGGGARGFAHIGVVRALRQLGIPIDLVAGTSAGALIGAAVAADRSDDELAEMSRVFTRAGPFGDYTLPLFALVRGDRLARAIRRVHGDLHLEDLWLPCLVASANLTRRALEVHQRGPAWQALRASCSLPGVVQPHVQDGQLLVDGGVLNNLPVDLARAHLGGRVIAVDVGRESDFRMTAAAFPSPWRRALARLLGRPRQALPGLLDVIFGATLLSSETHSAAMRRLADVCLRPEVARFGLMELSRHQAIAEVGYRHALERLSGLAAGAEPGGDGQGQAAAAFALSPLDPISLPPAAPTTEAPPKAASGDVSLADLSEDCT